MSMMSLTIHILVLLFLLLTLWCVNKTITDKEEKRDGKSVKLYINKNSKLNAISELSEMDTYENELKDWLRSKSQDIYNKKNNEADPFTSHIDDLPIS